VTVPRALAPVLLRFGLGLGLCLIIGYLVFRTALWDRGSPPFECVTTGVLAAGVLALLRSDRLREAAALAAAFGLLRLGFAHSEGWTFAVAGALQVAGVFLVALIFDLLARRGILFGKFLVLGPLLAGVYLSTTPLAFFFRISGAEMLPTIMRFVFLGLLIGDAVGFGVEVADLLVLTRTMRAERAAGRSAAE